MTEEAQEGGVEVRRGGSRSNSEEDALEFRGIMKATSLIGGSAGAGVLISLVRVKLTAVLIGPAGLGLAGQFRQVTGLVAQLTGLGVGSSGVREMALAASSDDPELLSRRYAALSRLTLLTGLLGAAVLMTCAAPLASWSFGSDDLSEDLLWLAPVVFLGHLAAGHNALIQGQRRLKRLAALNILSSLGGVAVAAPLYYSLGIKGVVPALVAGAAIQFFLASRFSRSGRPRPTTMLAHELAREARGLVTLGVTFVAAGTMGTIATFLIRGKITDDLGLESVGLYTAAWALSGLFVKYILDAMGADYVPQLASITNDDCATNRAVNRQIEMGVLLSVGGLMGTQIFAPLAIEIFYDSRFEGAIYLLQLFTLAMIGQILFWPIGYVLQARAHLLAYGLLQAATHTAHVAIAFALIQRFSLNAVGYAMIAQSYLGGIATFAVVRHITGLKASGTALRTATTGLVLVLTSFSVCHLKDPATRYLIALILLAVALKWSAFTLRSRLGYESYRAALRRGS